jgi:GT2 family glycosyltransferase
MFFLDDIPVVGKLLPTVQATGRAAKPRYYSSSTTNKPLQIGWVGGTTMMMRREMIDDIGLLDENIFMYGEDVEYCLRAKKHHWDIAIEPQARVTHLGSASSSLENALQGELQAYLYLWAKHKPHWQRRLLKLLLFCGLKLRLILFQTVVHQPARVEAYQQALQLLN